VIFSGREILKRVTVITQDDFVKAKQLLKEGKIIVYPFPDTNKISKGISLELEIGKIKIPESPGFLKEICIDFTRSETLEEKFEISDKEKVFLHPNPRDFLRVETRQFLGIPADLVAQIVIGSKFATYGLEIIGEPAYLLPGFIGKVELNIKNSGNRPIALSPGLPIFQVIFELLSSPLNI
jgi:deoxycytidine triphosphate deaminase